MGTGWLIPIVIGTGNAFRQFWSRKPPNAQSLGR